MPIGIGQQSLRSKRQKVAQPPNSSYSWTTRLAFDGSNGSTSIIDSGSSPISFTAYGGCAIDTSASQFGGSSLWCPGGSTSASRVESAQSNNYAFGYSDFTIECWARITGWSGGHAGYIYNTLFDTRRASHAGLHFGFNNSRQAIMYNGGTTFFTGNMSFQLNTWYRIAVVRSGTTLSLVVDGSVDKSMTRSMNLTENLLTVGRNFDRAVTGDVGFIGWIDEFRVVNGAALY